MKLVLAARGSQEAGFTKPAGENYELCTAACVFFVDSCKGASIYDIRSGGGGGGSPKSRRKEHNQLICDSDKGGGGQQIWKFCGRLSIAPYLDGYRYVKKVEG